MTTFLSHLESAHDETIFPADRPQTTYRDRPLWVRYNLPEIKKAVTKEQIAQRPSTMWRYRELLPLAATDEPISLGENMTPLLFCKRLARHFGMETLWIKDESVLPTGSFKSRGQALAVTMARKFGFKRLAIASAGNAGGAMAAYAARAGLRAFVFMPQDTPVVNQYECVLAGARTTLVNGLISDCSRIVRDGVSQMDWFNLSTLWEPYRLEGKKTMGFELAEQLGWQLPDVILYPTGGGTGLIGMWKAFQELAELGWIPSDKKPRMVAVQSDGCCPIVRAFEAGQKHAEPFEKPVTIASGLRVPSAIGDFMILDAVRASRGTALAVAESRIKSWMQLAGRLEGIPICPESAACIGALEHLLQSGWIKPQEKVVVYNTGAAQKYVEANATTIKTLDINQEIDWRRIDSNW